MDSQFRPNDPNQDLLLKVKVIINIMHFPCFLHLILCTSKRQYMVSTLQEAKAVAWVMDRGLLLRDSGSVTGMYGR